MNGSEESGIEHSVLRLRGAAESPQGGSSRSRNQIIKLEAFAADRGTSPRPATPRQRRPLLRRYSGADFFRAGGLAVGRARSDAQSFASLRLEGNSRCVAGARRSDVRRIVESD